MRKMLSPGLQKLSQVSALSARFQIPTVRREYVPGHASNTGTAHADLVKFIGEITSFTVLAFCAPGC